MRLDLVRGNAVAIIDVSAISWASWQRIGPQFLAFTSTLSIGTGSPPPAYGSSPPSGAGRAVAGLYMGFTTKWEALFGNRPALYYYLFSADGRIYRAYDGLSVPGNDPARFDFAAARHADAANSGQYTIRGNSMVVRIGASETFEVPLPTKTRSSSEGFHTSASEPGLTAPPASAATFWSHEIGGRDNVETENGKRGACNRAFGIPVDIDSTHNCHCTAARKRPAAPSPSGGGLAWMKSP